MQKSRGLLSSLFLVASLILAQGCSGPSNPQPTTTTSAGGSPTPAAADIAPTAQVQQTVQQVTAIIASAKAWQQTPGHSFKDLTTKRAIADGIVPKEMEVPGGLRNAWEGPASIEPSPLPGPDSFTIVLSSVPNRDCASLALQLMNQATVFAGNWGPEYQPKNQEQAVKNCTTGNMWILPK
jgi:hypothetical protein